MPECSKCPAVAETELDVKRRDGSAVPFPLCFKCKEAFVTNFKDPEFVKLWKICGYSCAELEGAQ